MEDVIPKELKVELVTIESQLDDTEQNDDELLRLCQILELPDNVTSLAVSLKTQLCNSDADEMKNQKPSDWNICAIYVAAIDSRMPYGPADPQLPVLDTIPFTVTDLLQAAKARIGDFFQSMKLMKNCYSLSETVLQHLLQVERKYLITCPLFIKFEKMFDEIFDKDGVSLSSAGEPVNCGDEGYQERKKFCWMLFVYMKSVSREQRGGRSELVFSFHLLLCCIEYVVRLTPSFQLRSPFDAARISAGSPSVEMSILQELSDRYQANCDEVKLVQMTYVCSIIQGLPLNNGIIDVEKVVSNYRASYRAAGDINELDFLTNEPYLIIQYVTGREPTNGNVAKQSAAPQQMATPVRSAMTSIQHLASLLQQCADGPSTTLLTYMERCSVNPMPCVKDRLQQLEVSFIHLFTAASGDKLSAIAAVRYKLAARLYYRVMEALLKLEEERLGEQDFSRLLNKAVFHKCLLACSAEVVLVTYEAHSGSNIQSPSVQRSNSSSLLFPWILGVFDINAFDFLKVLESFVRAEPKLAPEVIKHLRLVENQILEELAWQNNSPVFELLRNYDGPRQSVISLSPLKHASVGVESVSQQHQQENSPSSRYIGTAANHETSPINRSNVERVPPTLVVSTTPDQNSVLTEPSPVFESPTLSPRRSHSVNLFLNKVFRLAYQHLQYLCNMLGISGELMHKIWTCFESCVTHRTGLLRDRHLDQILMCCIYAICKVADKEIKFKSIVSVYRMMPNTSQQVYKGVMITLGEHDSIISFYNRIFMQSLKSYILQFAPNMMSPAAQSPIPKPMVPPLQTSPKYQLPGRQNFYISPMKNSPFKLPMSPSHMTPRTRQLYSFGEGPLASEKLRAINERLRMAAPPTSSRSSKCLKFDQIEGNLPANQVQTIGPTTEHLDSGLLKRKTPSSRKSLTFEVPPATSVVKGDSQN